MNMKILFVDNKEEEFERFRQLPFAKKYSEEIEFRKSPIGLPKVIEENPDLRLIILDLLWESDELDKAIELGAEAMKELSDTGPSVPVIIHSIIDDEETLHRLIPEMMRLGAYDWISKIESKMVRSARFERAYAVGRTSLPKSRSLLSPDQQNRSKVHVAAMFVDISGFTALSEEVQASDLIPVLREFYNLVGQTIYNHQGYVDKYIGDAVMAYFGATGKQEASSAGIAYGHVIQCLNSAKIIQNLAASFRHEHIVPILTSSSVHLGADVKAKIGSFRIGIESGLVEVVRFERGNESEVTVIGPPINIAARILNAGGPNEIWIGENARSTGAMADDIIDQVKDKYKNIIGEINRYRVKNN
jgi:class 3 adenylate cyclase